LVGKNKIFIEKDRALQKIFTGLSFRSEDTAIKMKQKFESVWQMSLNLKENEVY
jgi:hypothetical protein